MITKNSSAVVPIPTQADNSANIPNIKLVAEFLQFINWRATPRNLREQKTQKEFAKKFDVSEDTLTDWKKHPQFQPLVDQNIMGWMQDRRPDVIGGLYERAVVKGSSRDVEAFLRLSGMDTNKSENK